MRAKKAIINSSIGALSFFLGFIPMFILRKLFIDSLGSELLGLNSLFTNLISYLSLAELGIGTAIIFSLYKPFVLDDKVKIKGYLNYYKNLYRIIGGIIFICGVILLPFLHLFIKDDINISDVRIYFILFLSNTVSSYFFSYKFSLLIVSQQEYIISLSTSIAKILIALIQAILLVKYANYNYYLICQLIINIIFYFLLNTYINYQFPWMKKTEGKLEIKEKISLLKSIKSLFLHKVGSLIVFGTDNLIISSFLNLRTLTKYNNYSLLISAIQGIISTALNAITPIIGNLLVSSPNEDSYLIHRRLFFLNSWISSFVCITLFNTISQFITLWLGEDQILDNFTLAIILLNLHFQLMRMSVETFKNGSGNYHQDRYASLFEAAINLICSIILIRKIGLPGVFLGTFISNIAVVFWVKPKVTYKYVFSRPLSDYFKMYFKFLLITIIPLVSTLLLTSQIKGIDTLLGFFINVLINIIVINGIYVLLFWKHDEYIYFRNLFFNSITVMRNKFNISGNFLIKIYMKK